MSDFEYNSGDCVEFNVENPSEQVAEFCSDFDSWIKPPGFFKRLFSIDSWKIALIFFLTILLGVLVAVPIMIIQDTGISLSELFTEEPVVKSLKFASVVAGILFLFIIYQSDSVRSFLISLLNIPYRLFKKRITIPVHMKASSDSVIEIEGSFSYAEATLYRRYIKCGVATTQHTTQQAFGGVRRSTLTFKNYRSRYFKLQKLAVDKFHNKISISIPQIDPLYLPPGEDREEYVLLMRVGSSRFFCYFHEIVLTVN